MTEERRRGGGVHRAERVIPLYSRIRMSGYNAAALKETLTVLAPAAAATMFLA